MKKNSSSNNKAADLLKVLGEKDKLYVILKESYLECEQVFNKYKRVLNQEELIKVHNDIDSTERLRTAIIVKNEDLNSTSPDFRHNVTNLAFLTIKVNNNEINRLSDVYTPRFK